MNPNKLRGRFDVSVDGKTIPVLVNMNSLRLLTENEEIGLSDFDKEIQKNPLSFVPRLLYWGAVNMAQRAVAGALPRPGGPYPINLVLDFRSLVFLIGAAVPSAQKALLSD